MIAELVVSLNLVDGLRVEAANVLHHRTFSQKVDQLLRTKTSR